MTFQAWRIVERKHAGQAFSGEGARRFGGRWNSPGVPMVYTAEHASLAILEILVHLEAVSLLPAYVLFRIEFEQALVGTIDDDELPADWSSYPAPAGLRAIGDRWAAEERSAILSVPSVIVPIERLNLLNPRHPDFQHIELGERQPISLDPRLRKR
jgi:RES domain-containing protein